MKKLLLSVAITSALGLTACDGDTIAELAKEAEVVLPASRVVYDPGNTAGPIFPIPNDLAFSDTTDGTLNVTGERGLAPGQLPDYNDPSTAVGGLDGWSTTVPFAIEIDLGTDELTLDAASVSQPGAVHLFEATLGGPLSPDAECQPNPSISMCKMGRELTFGVDFVTSVSGNQVAIVPLKPLKAAQGHVLVLTNKVMDSAGNPIKPSTSYEGVARDIDTLPLPLPDQFFLQTLINSYENGAASAGVDKSTIVYTSGFTTQSIQDVLQTVKGVMATVPGAQPAMLPLQSKGVNAAQALGLNPDAEGVVASFAEVYGSTLHLPYYLDEVTADNCSLPDNCDSLNSRWQAMGDSPVTVLGALQSGVLPMASFGAQYAAQAPAFGRGDFNNNPANLVGMTFTIDTPVGPMQLDATRHLTKFNPLPTVKSVQAVDVIATMPDVDRINAIRQLQAGSGEFTPIEKPAAGWPVAIFGHGLGNNKETGLAIAGALADAGIATVAIDLPLHGSRAGTASTPLGEIEIDAAGEHLSAYLNLQSLLTARDNLRQGEADQLALRFALNGFGGQGDLDVSQVSFVGTSLGAITGTTFAALANSGIVDPTTGQVSPINPYQLSAATLSVPAGGLSGSLIYGGYGPTVKAGLTASDTFQGLLTQAAASQGIDAATLAQLAEANTPDYQALVDAVYAPFAIQYNFIAQTLLDSGDPINYGQTLAATQLPVMMTEVVGDGADNLPDTVVPNTVPGLPLVGTEALIATIGLDNVTATLGNGTEPVSGVLRYIKGHHGSILSPFPIDGVAPDAEATMAVTVELQTQMASFLATGGKLIPVSKPELLAGE